MALIQPKPNQIRQAEIPGATVNDNALKALLQGMQAGQEGAGLASREDIAKQQLAIEQQRARTAQQQANTMESYRKDEIKNKRLEMLLKGVGGKTSAEAQKLSNLVDVARQNLDNTEEVMTENPKTAIAYNALQSIPLVGAAAKPLAMAYGGVPREIATNVAGTKEALQNYYTGAAATGDQSVNFSGMATPGIIDILGGKAGLRESTKNVRNDLDAFQHKAGASAVTPELLKQMGLQNDPIAKSLVPSPAAPQQRRVLTPEQRKQRIMELRAKRGY